MLRADDLAPADVFWTLWRHRFAAIAVGIVCAAMGYGYSLFIKDSYTASTLVLVEDQSLPAGYARSTATLNFGQRLHTLSERILSRARLEHLVQEYSLYGNPADPVEREAIFNKLGRKVVVKVRGNDSFRISFEHDDPRIAADVANSLANFFIRDSERELEQQVAGTTSGLQAQLERVRQQLDAEEKRIREFKTANMGMLPEELSINLRTIDRLQLNLTDNASRQSEARGRKLQIEIDMVGVPGAVVETSAVEQARQLLASTTSEADLTARIASQPPHIRMEALKLQRESLLRQYTARHPDVQMIESQIAALERELAALPAISKSGAGVTAVASSVDLRLEAVNKELRRLQTEARDIEQQLETLQMRVARAPEVEEQLSELEREHNTLFASYQSLMSKNIDAELAGNLQSRGPTAQFRVIDPAVVPQSPSSPMRVLFLLGGGVVGFGLVCAGALMYELAVEPLNTADEVEKYASLQVLASIPFIETQAWRRKVMLWRYASVGVVLSVLAVVFALRLVMRPL